MSIFTQIITLKPEDRTTEILVYALKGSKSLRDKFLELTGMSGESISNEDINTQVQDSDAKARPDICIETKNAILYVENKPWFFSDFTTGTSEKKDQIKRYADKLVNEHGNIAKRFLCLLTIQQTRFHQLQTIARVEEQESVNDLKQQYEILRDYYKGYKGKGIIFITLTWRELLDSLLEQCENKSDAAAFKAVLESLNEDISDPANYKEIESDIELFHSQYESLRAITEGAITELEGLNTPFFRPDKALGPSRNPFESSANDHSWRCYLKYETLPHWGIFHWGISTYAYPHFPEETHNKHPHPFIFCIELNKTSDSKPCGVLRENARVPLFRFGDKRTKDYLERNGFTLISRQNIQYFVKPLNLKIQHFSEITSPDKIVNAVIESANEYAEICKTFVNRD